MIAGLVQHGYPPDHPLMQLLTEQLEGRLEALHAPPSPNAPSPDERHRHRERNAELVKMAELAIAADDPEAGVLVAWVSALREELRQ